MQEFHVILKQWCSFFVFLFERLYLNCVFVRVMFIYYKVYLFFFFCEKNKSLVILLYQTLHLLFVCWWMTESCWGLLVCDTFLFCFSHWMMLVQVFLILTCIIFEHGSVAFTVGTISPCSHNWTLLEDLAALIGWMVDGKRVRAWQSWDVNEACHVIAKPS